jgi:hypothetical protein
MVAHRAKIRARQIHLRSPRAGQRTAAVMRLIQSATLNGHDPFAWLQHVFTRLPSLAEGGSRICFSASAPRAVCLAAVKTTSLGAYGTPRMPTSR